jgi:UDP-3-O-[3-hydroxymyristoyl] N-acetylglucosamine deacetylase
VTERTMINLPKNLELDKQCTVKHPFSLEGIGVHTGVSQRVNVSPLPAQSGIWFVKKEADNLTYFPALMSHSQPFNLATCVGVNRKNSVKTVEHLLSALYGIGVDNALISVEGDEIPIMDGSALPFVEAILKVGIKTLPANKRILILKDEFYQESHGSSISFVPGSSKTFRVSFEIEFDHPRVGLMDRDFDIDPETYVKEICKARTFGFWKDRIALHKIGLGLGASEENTIILTSKGIRNKEKLRYPDEFVRHKICDALGDLALTGVYLRGNLRLSKSGHALNRQFSKWVFEHAMKKASLISTRPPQVNVLA